MHRLFLYQNESLVKTTFYTIAFLALIYGCNEAASNGKATHVEDSLQYYPPTPSQIDKQEFRQYHRLLSAYFDSMLEHWFVTLVPISRTRCMAGRD